MRRRFVDAPADLRCNWKVRLKDGSEAQCGRRKRHDDLCTQHSRIDRRWACEYCGGNDEYPREHTQDCSRPTKESTHG